MSKDDPDSEFYPHNERPRTNKNKGSEMNISLKQLLAGVVSIFLPIILGIVIWLHGKTTGHDITLTQHQAILDNISRINARSDIAQDKLITELEKLNKYLSTIDTRVTILEQRVK